MTDAIDTLLATATAFQPIRLTSTQLDANGRGALQAYTQAQYDREWIDSGGVTECFVDDTDVTGKMGTSNAFAFCSMVFDTDNFYAVFRGNGHAIGDGGIYKADLVAGAASRNAAGSGAAWTKPVKSPTYKTVAQGKPAYNHHGASDSYYAWANVDGVNMPQACHNYFQPYLGGGYVSICGTFSFISAAGGIDDIWIYNTQTDAVTQVLNSVWTPTGYGFNNQSIAAYNAHNGKVYHAETTIDNGAWRLFSWDDPTGSLGAPAPNNFITYDTVSQKFITGKNQLVIPDPANNGKYWLWQHRADAVAGNAQFVYVPDIETSHGSVPFSLGTYAGAANVPFTGTLLQRNECYDAQNNLIWVYSGSSKVWSISVDGNWTITEYTLTGTEVPNALANGTDAFNISIGKLANKQALVVGVSPGVVSLIPLQDGSSAASEIDMRQVPRGLGRGLHRGSA